MKFTPLFKLICLTIFTKSANVQAHKKPNVLLIVADDLGFYDVSFHNQKRGPLTPHIDKLAASGVKLHNYYVQPLCTPTRSALMASRLPIRDGLQHSVIMAGQAKAMPINHGVKIMPEHLNGCGYSSHLVGKWHLGHFHKMYWPTNRGFESFQGYLTGAEDYYTRLQCYGGWQGLNPEGRIGPCGLDFRDGERPAATDEDTLGRYSTHVFNDKAKAIVDNHDFDENPLFLYYALQSVHEPVQVPKNYTDKFAWVKDTKRRDYYGMVAAMDESIGRLIDTFTAKNQIENTIIVFTSDNGGLHSSGGYNWPLRGEKYTVWEGGVRSIGFVTGPGIPKSSTSHTLFHVSDWLPTILGLANCTGSQEKSKSREEATESIHHFETFRDTGALVRPEPADKVNGGNLQDNLATFSVQAARHPSRREYDGVDQSQALRKTEFSQRLARSEILVNIDPLQRAKKRDNRPWINTTFDITSTAALIHGPWKIITGRPKPKTRYRPPEFDQENGVEEPRFKGYFAKKYWRNNIPIKRLRFVRISAALRPARRIQTVYLFNVANDPVEDNEISDRYPATVNYLLGRLEEYQRVQVPPQNSPGFAWKSSPHLHGGYWDAWY